MKEREKKKNENEVSHRGLSGIQEPTLNIIATLITQEFVMAA